MTDLKRIGWLFLLSSIVSLSFAAEADKPKAASLPVATLQRSTTIDFEKEILPILKNNCLACHSQTKPKAELILETPATILKGGESGPAVKPGQADESLLFQAAAHQSDPIMPPRSNKVGANDLTPDELALLKLWIDQGAKGEVSGPAPIEWKRLPEGLNPIFSVAVSEDGQFAACGRANQIFIYHVPTGQLLTRLTDPSLLKSGLYNQPGVAHRDMVHSLAFHPDGTLLASGDYRQIKLWSRPKNVQALTLTASAPVRSLAVSPDRKWLAAAGTNSSIHLWNLEDPKEAKTLTVSDKGTSCLEFSPDNTWLAAASPDKKLRVWDRASGQLVVEFETPSEFAALRWLPNGKQIIAGGADHIIRLFSLSDAPKIELSLAQEFSGHTGPVTALALASTTNIVLSGSTDGTVRLWNIAEGKLIREVKHGAPVTALALTPDSTRFASAGSRSSAIIWEFESGKQVTELKGERSLAIQTARLERDLEAAKADVAYWKSTVESSTKDHKTGLERVKKAIEANGQSEKTLAEKQKAATDAAAAHAAAAKALADLNAELAKAKENFESADKTAAQLATDTKAAFEKSESVAKLEFAKLEEIRAKAFAAGLAKAALDRLSADLDPKIKEATPKAEAAKKSLDEAEKQLKSAQNAKSSAESELLQSISAAQKAADHLNEVQNSAQLADAELKKLETDHDTAKKNLAASEKPIRTLAFSPDGKTLATAGDDQLVHTWATSTGAALDTFQGHKSSIGTVAFSSPSKLISAGEDPNIVVWNLNPEWTLQRTIGSIDSTSPFKDRVVALKFSRDGRLLASGSGEPSRGGEIVVWNPADGKMIHEFRNAHSDVVLGLDFSADGKYLASSAADKFVRIIDLGTGKIARSFEGHTHHVLGVSWKRDGRMLASCGADNVVKTWDFVTGERRKTIDGFTKEVTSIFYLGNSDQLLVSAGDNQVRIVKDNGDKIRALEGVADFVHSASVTADGKIAIAGGQDSVLRIWSTADGKSLGTFAHTPERTSLAGR